MFYVDKLLEVILVVSINVLLIFLGRAIAIVFDKKEDINLSKIIMYFGLGSGVFGTSFFFFGAIIGLAKLPVFLFLFFFLTIAIVTMFRSQKEIRLFIKTLDIKSLNFFEKVLFTSLLLFVLYNIYRGLWPDVDFDSTWYHLTEPKIYLMREKISFIKGGLLYYSAMPQLIETFFLLGMFLKSGITAKLFHTFFGIWCALLAYVWGRDVGKTKLAGLTAALLFYASNLVFWESQNAYIDLGVTFFISLALWQFVKSLTLQKSRSVYLMWASLFLGFSLGTKLLSIYWVFIIIIANIFWLFITKQLSFKRFLMESTILGGIPLIMWFPWGLYGYLSTGNPVYPLLDSFFNHEAPFSIGLFDKTSLWVWTIERVKKLIEFPLTIISHEYGFNPLVIYGFLFSVLAFINKNKIKAIAIGVVLFVILWSFTPASGDRFFLPVTMLMSVYAGAFFFSLAKGTNWTKKLFVTIVILIFSFIQFYKNYYQFKPYVWVYSANTEDRYLKKNVSENIWAFYDYDGRVKRIVGDSNILVYNVHNLAHLSFKFEEFHSIQEDLHKQEDISEYLLDHFDYIFIKGSDIDHFFDKVGIDDLKLELVHEDSLAGIKLYAIFCK